MSGEAWCLRIAARDGAFGENGSVFDTASGWPDNIMEEVVSGRSLENPGDVVVFS